jgi:hypothetical protein
VLPFQHTRGADALQQHSAVHRGTALDFRRGSWLYYRVVLVLCALALCCFIVGMSLAASRDSDLAKWLLLAMVVLVVAAALVLVVATPHGASAQVFVVSACCRRCGRCGVVPRACTTVWTLLLLLPLACVCVCVCRWSCRASPSSASS